MPVKTTHSQLRILEYLHAYKDPETSQCTPSMKEIAAAVGLSRGHVQHLVSDLVQKGVLASEERWETYPGEEFPCRVSNLYRIVRKIARHATAIMSTLVARLFLRVQTAV